MSAESQESVTSYFQKKCILPGQIARLCHILWAVNQIRRPPFAVRDAK